MTVAFPLRALALTAICATVVSPSIAQEEGKTIPVGCIVLEIPAGTGSARTTTLLSFPLKEAPSITGPTAGVITGVSANALSDSKASWAQLGSPSSPIFVRITSGPAEGRTFLVSGNSQSEIQVSTSDGVSQTPVNLVSLGVAVGHSYELIQGDTLLSIFGQGSNSGNSSVLGASNPSSADLIQINRNNSWSTFFFNTTTNSWVNAGTEVANDNIILPPDSAILYHRLSSNSFELVVTGTVPSNDRKFIVRDGQTTVLSSFWPVQRNFSSLAIEQSPGWAKNSNPSLADKVIVYTGSTAKTIFHNGSEWRSFPANEVVSEFSLNECSGLIIKKVSQSSSGTELSESLPYSL